MRESGNSHSIYNKRKITGSRIIVINSDQAENDQILRILERISRNILTVDCSCKAEKVLNLEIPDMLIMSSVMLFSLHNPWLEPEKNGIRECPFPVLIIADKSERWPVHRMIREGVNDIIYRPIEASDLFSKTIVHLFIG